MALGKRRQILLEHEKQRLETKIAAAQKALDEIPRAIKSLFAEIFRPLLIEGKHDLDGKKLAALTSDERKFLGFFTWWTFTLANDQYSLEFVESLLFPKRGRPKQPIEPSMQAAISELVSGTTKTYGQLGIKHGGSADPAKYANKLKKKMRTMGFARRKNGK